MLLFLLLSILTGIILATSGVLIFAIVKIKSTNGVSWAIALLLTEIGLSFIGIPLTIIYDRLVLVGIIGFSHLLITYGYLVYRLLYDNSIDQD